MFICKGDYSYAEGYKDGDYTDAGIYTSVGDYTSY